jgi:predicted HAD superfamily Cof-like phosphohydrolase
MSTNNFRDVGEFHEKFDLPNMNDHSASAGRLDHMTNDELDRLLKFRIHFMNEELHEFALASSEMDHEKMFDALLDLAYVVFGTAHLLGYPWQYGWDEVQAANMTKERCVVDHHFEDSGHPVDLDVCDHEGCGKPRKAHSSRGSSMDVIKPKGWIAPALKGVLKRVGFNV